MSTEPVEPSLSPEQSELIKLLEPYARADCAYMRRHPTVRQTVNDIPCESITLADFLRSPGHASDTRAALDTLAEDMSPDAKSGLLIHLEVRMMNKIVTVTIYRLARSVPPKPTTDAQL